DEAWDAGKHLTEAAAAEEVDEAAATRKDSLTTIFRVMRLAPQAIRLESGWTQGVPKGLTRVQDHLKQQLGYDFPILRHIASGRQLRSLAAVLLHNLKPEGSTTGVAVKPLAGLVYANTVFSPHVKAIATGLLPLGGDPSAEVVEAMEALGYGEIPTPERYAEQIRDLAALPGLGEVEASLLLFAKTISPSPTEVPAELIGLLMEKLSPEQIIEMVTWVGILGLLHRLGAYYEQ
ncbi:MAG TPA: hypothetical protein DCP28_05500, partial [Cytophagales bacterium]|nr:hypothetical protein [Cytophagales bacterium]